MSVESLVAAERLAVLNSLQRKEIESLRAVLVHIQLDVEEWRASGSWGGPVLDGIEKRVREKLHEPPSEIDTEGAPR